MSEHNREDIQDKLSFMFLSLISNKINVGIIGGGNAGLIKAKSFISRDCKVSVVSREFIEEFYKLEDFNLEIIKKEYYEDFIRDKHIVIIAVDDYNLKQEIKKHCEAQYKIFIDSTNFNNGMGVVPAQRELNNLSFSVNTKGGNPKASVMLLNNMEKELINYDEFVGVISLIRNRAKSLTNKSQIITFITNSDFKFFYEKGYMKKVLLLFFDEKDVIYLLGGNLCEFDYCN